MRVWVLLGGYSLFPICAFFYQWPQSDSFSKLQWKAMKDERNTKPKINVIEKLLKVNLWENAVKCYKFPYLVLNAKP